MFRPWTMNSRECPGVAVGVAEITKSGFGKTHVDQSLIAAIRSTKSRARALELNRFCRVKY
jgi:hypothetical protein